MSRILILAVVVALSGEISTQDLLKRERAANEACRGWVDVEQSIREDICTRRNQLFLELYERGWCYGKKGQRRAEMDWHRCTKNSIQLKDLP